MATQRRSFNMKDRRIVKEFIEAFEEYSKNFTSYKDLTDKCKEVEAELNVLARKHENEFGVIKASGEKLKKIETRLCRYLKELNDIKAEEKPLAKLKNSLGGWKNLVINKFFGTLKKEEVSGNTEPDTERDREQV